MFNIVSITIAILRIGSITHVMVLVVSNSIAIYIYMARPPTRAYLSYHGPFLLAYPLTL